MSKDISEFCPLDKHCNDGVTRCKWYINYPVRDNEGNMQEDWRCAQVWSSVLLIELINVIRSLNKIDEVKVSH